MNSNYSALANKITITCPDCGASKEVYTVRSLKDIENMNINAKKQFVKSHGHWCPVYRDSDMKGKPHFSGKGEIW